MMIRMGRLTGLPVVLCGRSIAQVETPVLHPSGRMLRGLKVRRPLGGARWVDARDIDVLGEVSVIVRCKPQRPPTDTDFRLGTVKDSAGLLLGLVTDVIIDQETLRVHALEMVLGLTEAITEGRMLCRRFVTTSTGASAGEVLIPCGCWLEEPPQGGRRR